MSFVALLSSIFLSVYVCMCVHLFLCPSKCVYSHSVCVCVCVSLTSAVCDVSRPEAEQSVVCGLDGPRKRGQPFSRSLVCGPPALLSTIPPPPPGSASAGGIIATHSDDLWPHLKPAKCVCVCEIIGGRKKRQVRKSLGCMCVWEKNKFGSKKVCVGLEKQKIGNASGRFQLQAEW